MGKSDKSISKDCILCCNRKTHGGRKLFFVKHVPENLDCVLCVLKGITQKKFVKKNFYIFLLLYIIAFIEIIIAFFEILN